MDTADAMERIREFWGKYRWAALILAVGLALMALPGDPAPEAETPTQPELRRQEDLESRLEEVLCRLEGAGQVKVLLTVASGEEYHYQTDEDRDKTQESTGLRSETVILTDADRSQQGLIRRKDPPQYLGAVVLCQGADRAGVRLAVVDAVATATGLTSDKISVWKMK